jgi:predicted RNase H-like HicB family nuclease
MGPGVYECRVWLCPEPDGGFSAIAPTLPGVASQGETEREAIDNIREAFQGAIAEYLESDGNIPWLKEALGEKPRDAREKWILVDV